MSALHALVRRAVVRISAASDGYDPLGTGYWGSGFFVAPGWVMTCAHVVGTGGGAVWRGERVVGISWDGGTAVGEVALALPPPDDPGRPPRTWPLPDLALVRVPGAPAHECVWLSDISTGGPVDISLHGWSSETGDVAYRWVVGETSGRDGRDGGAMLLRGEQPVGGCSGGPVVDTRSGSVIGMCKARIADDPTAGHAVPVTALRALCDLPGGDLFHDVLLAHDRYHLERHQSARADDSWTDVQAELRPEQPGGFGPVLRANLYGRLAGLTPPRTPGEVTVLVDDVKRRVFREAYQPGVDHDPRSWREGAGLLYGLRDRGTPGKGPGGNAELEAVLLYAAKVWAAVGRLGRPRDEAPLRELRTWLERTAEPLPRVVRQEIEEILDAYALPGSEGGPRADVLVEIDQSLYGDRYPWRVKLLYDGRLVTPLHGDEQGVPRARLREALREPIADALRRGDVGEYLAVVEVALPPELFDEPLDAWRLGPRRTPDGRTDPYGLPLGERRVVVVRDRRRAGTGNPEWRRRWSGVQRGPLTAIPLRGAPLPDPERRASGEDRTGADSAAGQERTGTDSVLGQDRAAGQCRALGQEDGPVQAPGAAQHHRPGRHDSPPHDHGSGHLHHPGQWHGGPRGESWNAAYDRLSRASWASVPVFCGPVAAGDGATAMDAALTAGHPVAIWRRCATPHTDCAEFHRAVERLVREAGRADGLHAHIRSLRIRAGDPDPERDEAAWARSIALLFDPPDRPGATGGPLYEPGMAPERPT
ncbi:VMAP-C domain-containing protein [Streptomyces sp. 8N706]|uniref:VMAP-C domain-containing protein n=1 Tax=Streptomyces sp. 8N706 TaxID=3457416 RepID=UPI003FD5887B